MSKRKGFSDSPEDIDAPEDIAPLSESTPSTDPMAPAPPPPPPPSVDTTHDVKGRTVDEQTPPLEAPKAIDTPGTFAAPPTPEIRHPELEPAAVPPLTREAPPAPEMVERETWGDKPTYDQLKEAKRVLVRSTDVRSLGLYVGGVRVIAQESELLMQTVADRGESHLRALASDPAVEVKIIE